ncbi:hypothetical protein BHM03_00040188 [Ensete ventricosum]|nr:hypothetical protein BHM03_00040188 [Ensete ventricosum]
MGERHNPIRFFCSLPLFCLLLASSPSLLLFDVSSADFANILGLPLFFFPLIVSQAGRMSSASSHSESCSFEMSTHRSRALSRPSGDSRLTALVSVFGGAALTDFGTVDALMVMRSNFDVGSIMMIRRLVEVRKNYFIPSKYELHAPLPGEHPYDAFPNGFSLSIDALKAGLRFPLHSVIEACLEGWQISPSQMAPNSWRYLIAFLWEYFGSGVTTTQDLFMASFRLSRGQAGYDLTARAGFKVGGAPSSNKGWKS